MIPAFVAFEMPAPRPTPIPPPRRELDDGTIVHAYGSEHPDGEPLGRPVRQVSA